MEILKKLSIKNLRLNKKRTISTIIGIILSVALICAVATMVSSFQETLIENAINQTGYYHLQISNVTEDNIRDIKNNRDIKDIYTINDVGYGKLNGIKNEDKPYLHVYSMNEKSFENLKFKVLKGNLPKNENEVIISNHIINNGKVKLDVGDIITLDVGERLSLDNFKLKQSNPYNMELEKLVNITKRSFKVVGIMERPEYSFESYVDPGYTVITNNISTGSKNIYISLNEPGKYKTSISEILGAKDYNEIRNLNSDSFKYEDWDVNEELLRWEAFAFSDDTVSMLYAVSAVVIFIIIFTSIFCIRNSFAIATTEKIKMYGMLSSVGATKKQIRKNVIFEAMVLGLIGIPLGILSGLFADFVLLKIVNALLGDYLLGYVDGIIYKISIIPIIISVVLGFITIYLSAISSARKASKVSPIEQLRNSDDIKIKNNKLKAPKIVEKIFKTGGVLAYKNLKRSKKKYRTTVVSISVSIFIFITMNAFITNAFDLTGNYYKDYDYNLIMYNGMRDLPQEDIDKILSLDNIEEKFILYTTIGEIKVKDLSKINQVKGIELSNDYYIETDENGKEKIIYTDEKISSIALFALDNESFKKYCKKIDVDYNKVKDKGILCDEYEYYDEDTNKTKEIRRYKYEKEDTIMGICNDKQISIEVGAISSTNPYGLENTYYGGGFLIVNIDEYKDLDFVVSNICVNSKNPDKLEEEIKNLNFGISVNNIDSEVRQERSMILVIKIFLYGFITVITLIGVTNIFNTITSNMELRQKEFAMLKSIGMTKKEFNRMINLETLFYGTKSLIYGIILGLLGTFALYRAFSVKIDSGAYIPIKPILLSIIFVFILIFIIMKYSIAKINKQNTIETIRKENI